MSKLFHVRIESSGTIIVNEHFSEDQLKVRFKNAYWLKPVLEMDKEAHFEYFTPNTITNSIKVKRVQ